MYLREKAIKTLIKWPGGKHNDIIYLQQAKCFPEDIDRYFEPFLGGGAMWLTIQQKPMFVNDVCKELILFYELIRDEDKEFYDTMNRITDTWNTMSEISKNPSIIALFLQTGEKKVTDRFVTEFLEKNKEKLCRNLFTNILEDQYFETIRKCTLGKFNRTKSIAEKLTHEDLLINFDAGLKAGLYTHIRNIFNHTAETNTVKVCCFYFIRRYCFSLLFRYNLKGEFNVPYGGTAFNRKRPNAKFRYWKNQNTIDHLKHTSFFSLDFYDFLHYHKPQKNDFIFLDPPYDSEFSEYAKNPFSWQDQQRLASYLINECEAKFMAIMKNTGQIEELYSSPKIKLTKFNKSSVNFRGRKNRTTEHILLTNY